MNIIHQNVDVLQNIPIKILIYHHICKIIYGFCLCQCGERPWNSNSPDLMSNRHDDNGEQLARAQELNSTEFQLNYALGYLTGVIFS